MPVRRYNRVSVLIPTRKRVEKLKGLIASYEKTSSERTSELIFRVDDDDKETLDELYKTRYSHLIGSRLDGYKSLPSFFNDLACYANGELLLCGNDDMEFKTPGWAEILCAEAEKYEGYILAIGVNTFNAANFPFTVVPRRMVEVMGQLYDPRLLFHDVFLRDVAACFGRAVRVESVEIAHHWAGFDPDTTHLEAREQTAETVYDEKGGWKEEYTQLHAQVVHEYVKKLESSYASVR